MFIFVMVNSNRNDNDFVLTRINDISFCLILSGTICTMNTSRMMEIVDQYRLKKIDLAPREKGRHSEAVV